MKRLLILFSLFFCICCSPDDERLEVALTLAGDNRRELEKVLEHYKGDPEKLQAARFLIENMPGHAGQDAGVIRKLQPVYDKHASISEKHNWELTKEWEKEIDSLWYGDKNNSNVSDNRQDIVSVQSGWLINEIDRSFKAWKENAYTGNTSFEDFCRHILPYRFAEGICLDDSRDVFYQRHAHFFNDQSKDFIAAADSLLEIYGSLVHSKFAAMSMPIYSASTFEQIKRGTCDDRTWFNCLLMSSLGMAVATDFVPQWGNRNGGHSWNSLIVDGETYPFEPFWDEDRWKYKRIYNNECFDFVWDKFRLPKVYRHTYEHNIDGPMGDKRVDRSDIPGLFLNPFVRDVSSQYFQAVDVEVFITEDVPKDARYCYLCVFTTRGWQPVQWGKIKRKKAVFKDMGKDIVYLPMFCKNGRMIQAGSAFILNREGVCEEVRCDDEKISVTVREYTPYGHVDNMRRAKNALTGACLLGCNGADDSNADTLFVMPGEMSVWEDNTVTLPEPGRYRYLRLVPLQDTVALCEISFFEHGSNGIPVQDVKVSADIVSFIDNEELGMISDGLSGTGFRGLFETGEGKGKGILFDLGESRMINAFSYMPYTPCCQVGDADLEFCYWDGSGWVSVDSFRLEGSPVTFENIPGGTVYAVRHPKKPYRIFTCDNGIVKWY